MASTALSTAPTTYLQSSSFDLLDPSGTSLIGSLARNTNLQRIHWAHCFGNDAQNQTGINFVSFAVDPRAAFSNGANSGYCIFTSNERLIINLGANITTASHIIDIRAYMHESVVFDSTGIRAVRD